jgi:hypothetical protein
MNDEIVKGVHWSFWLISVLALLWNVGGSINYLMQTNPEFVATLPETHRAIIEGRPAWATGGFAIGVFGGALGCLLLLFRKPASLYVFIASLIGVMVTIIHTVVVASSKIDFSPGEIIVMILLPVIVAALLIWYTKRVMSKNWIN